MSKNDSVPLESIKKSFSLAHNLALPIISEPSEQQNSVIEQFRTSPFLDFDSFLQYERDISELEQYRESVPKLAKRFHQSVLENEHMEGILEDNEVVIARLGELKSEMMRDLAMADARRLVWQSEIRELENSLEAHTGLAI